MSASQQAPDLQSASGPVTPELHPTERHGYHVAVEARDQTDGSETQSAPDTVPDDALRAIVEMDISSDDIQPMLDLRFPDEPSSPQLEPEVYRSAETPVEPTDEVEEAVAGGIDPPRQSDLGDAGGLQASEAGTERSVAGSAGSFDPDVQATGEAPGESMYEPQVETSVPLSTVQEAPREPVNHASAPDTADGERAQPDAAAPQPEPPDEHDSTAQKIAAEATATAEALENLKRLLVHKIPLQASEGALQRPPFLHAQARTPPEAIAPVLPPGPLQPEDIPLPHHEAAIDPPALATQAERRRGRFDIRGFLAGFALSWAFGAALYMYLILS